MTKNIVDTVFQNQSSTTVVAAGGVALNKAVIDHIGQLKQIEIIVDEHAHVYGALGAALYCQEEEKRPNIQLTRIEDIVIAEKKDKKYYYPPLQLSLSDYPDFESHEKYEFKSVHLKIFLVREVYNLLYWVPALPGREESSPGK